MPNTNKPDTSKVLPKPGPDPSEKLLEDYADVFSDIVNVLVYQGESVVKPENLRDGPTASMYKTIYGRLRQKNRDVLKFDMEHGVEVRVYGLENQSKSSNIMPVRVMGVTVQIPLELLRHTAIWNRFAMGRMPATATYSYGQRGERADLSELLLMGYDFSSYDRDILRKKAENKAAGHEADYAAELWPEQKLCPVVTLVLYFGAEPWSGPTSLVDMLNLPDNLKGYVSDYHINLVQVAFLEDEVISKL